MIVFSKIAGGTGLQTTRDEGLIFLVKSQDEHLDFRMNRLDAAGRFRPAQVRRHRIHEYNVRLHLVDQMKRLPASPCLAYNLEVGCVVQQSLDPRPE